MNRYKYSETESEHIRNSVIPTAVYQYVDKRVVTIELSDGFMELFGFTDRKAAHDLMDDDMYRYVHPDDVARIADAAVRFAVEDDPYNVVYRALIGEEYRIIHSYGKHIFTDDGTKLAVVWYVDEGAYIGKEEIHDGSITRNYSISLTESSLKRKSDHDQLTGIPNMTYFFELAVASRDEVLAAGGHCCVGYADFNGMKYYNQKYGFAEGDRILKSFAGILAKYFGSTNICRIAQDNFAFFAVLDGLEEKLRGIFIEVDELSVEKTMAVRIGIYTDLMGICETSLACDRARTASNTLRNSPISDFRYFDETMLRYENNRQYVLDNLERALKEHWIQAYYQPIVRAANGRVCDEEALARWIDPEKGMLSPADFIPILEDSKLIYKVDLYMLDEIIKKIKTQQEAGLYVVPTSLNLSRTDFDACDIVDEICTRLDKAGIGHDMITIEITESVIGTDFEFMKKQVERFQSLGFKVWMDDFGSGYSSLDLLQSLRFDLIKLDMRFMKQFDNTDKSKVIVTELMKMAIGLGMETVSEGVERPEQVEFLREIGCTKLQGFHFCMPLPFEEILERNKKGAQIGFENPRESSYYESLGKINLYDMSAAINDAPEGFDQYFNTIPMAIIETGDRDFNISRCNKAYREFFTKTFGPFETGVFTSYDILIDKPGYVFAKAVMQCARTGETVFVDEGVGNNSTVHAMVRYIAANPVTGVSAVNALVLGISSDEGKGITYADIANSLSADYIDLYYVNADTDAYIQYHPDPSNKELSAERHGKQFFLNTVKTAHKLVYKDDLDMFTRSFVKEDVIKAIDEHGAFTLTFRILMDDEPKYVNLKAVRMKSDENYLIIGVNNVDAQMRQQEALEKMLEEKALYSRISALAGSYICIYSVDPETDEYTEYGSSEEFAKLGLDRAGHGFYEKAKGVIERFIHPEDLEMFVREFTRENVLHDVYGEGGIFEIKFRLMIHEKPLSVRFKVAKVEESDGTKLIVGLSDIDARTRIK